MRFAIFLPPFAEFAEPRRVVELSRQAEEAGWDGLFFWDHMLAFPGMAVADPWVVMAAVAAVTERIRLGALVTPLPRRRPWVLSRQMATLDRLSEGRLIGGIGLGDDGWTEFSSFGEAVEPVIRGEMLDESLELLKQFLRGEPVSFDGRHYTIDSPALLPTARARSVATLGCSALAESEDHWLGSRSSRAVFRSSTRPERCLHPTLPTSQRCAPHSSNVAPRRTSTSLSAARFQPRIGRAFQTRSQRSRRRVSPGSSRRSLPAPIQMWSCASSSRGRPRRFSALLADDTVQQLARCVCVPGMPGGLVDEVQQHKTQVSPICVECWLRQRRRAYI